MELGMFMESLMVMWKGMLAVFAVMAILAGGLGILNRFLGQKEGDKPPKEHPAE